MFIPGGGNSVYSLVGRCGLAPDTLTLFKTKIAAFPTLFKTEFQFLIPCLKHLCIGQIEASTSLPIWLFWKLLFKFPPTRAKIPFKCPTLGSIQVIKCPHPRDISQAQKWQRTAETPSVVEQNLYKCNKNWETLLAYLLRTKVSCKAAEIAATRSLNAQLFFVM